MLIAVKRSPGLAIDVHFKPLFPKHGTDCPSPNRHLRPRSVQYDQHSNFHQLPLYELGSH